ncbi:MAG: hypothetical protein PHN45_00955 [Methylococcales bacterium]|nr:hypothetical protein [Methylococcales bacterium]MDD5753308.1 hypothetical protein [Methylococcales bacterium]
MKRLLLISISALFLDGCVYPSPYGYSRYTTITPVYPRTYYEHRYYTSPPRYHYYERNDRRPYFQQRHHW